MVHVFSPPVLALCSLGLCMSSSCLKQHTIHWCYHANSNNLSLQKSPSFALPYQPVKEQPIRLNVGFQLLIRSSSGIKDLSHRFLKWVTNTPSGEYMPLKVDYMKHGDRCSYIGHAAFRTTLPANNLKVISWTTAPNACKSCHSILLKSTFRVWMLSTFSKLEPFKTAENGAPQNYH